jgi:hypothetical protein
MVVICVQMHMHVCFLYIVLFNALFLNMHITPFQFLPVSQQMYLCDTFRLIAVCPNYYVLCLGQSVPHFFKKWG